MPCYAHLLQYSTLLYLLPYVYVLTHFMMCSILCTLLTLHIPPNVLYSTYGYSILPCSPLPASIYSFLHTYSTLHTLPYILYPSLLYSTYVLYLLYPTYFTLHTIFYPALLYVLFPTYSTLHTTTTLPHSALLYVLTLSIPYILYILYSYITLLSSTMYWLRSQDHRIL